MRDDPGQSIGRAASHTRKSPAAKQAGQPSEGEPRKPPSHRLQEDPPEGSRKVIEKELAQRERKG